MEQISGLAWLTGHADDQPRIQRGPCDPLAGATAAFAAMVALFERDVTGRGAFVECPMVEAALNAAAEQVIEYTAYGRLHAANGQSFAARRSAGDLSVPRSRAGARTMARPIDRRPARNGKAWLRRPGRSAVGAGGAPCLARRTPRCARRIDEELRTFLLQPATSTRRSRMLTAAGVPAARVEDPRADQPPPADWRRAASTKWSSTPLPGSHPVPTLPFRYAGASRFIRSPAPTMGQHNRDILAICSACGGRLPRDSNGTG